GDGGFLERIDRIDVREDGVVVVHRIGQPGGGGDVIALRQVDVPHLVELVRIGGEREVRQRDVVELAGCSCRAGEVRLDRVKHCGGEVRGDGHLQFEEVGEDDRGGCADI